MATNKMTKKDYFSILREMSVNANRNDLVAFIDHEVELINKKNSAERGLTTTQLENNEIKAYLVANIGDKAYTITEMIKAVFSGSKWPEISVSKLTALCGQLVKAGALTQYDDKRKSYYKAKLD